jgi:hypothetical protein
LNAEIDLEIVLGFADVQQPRRGSVWARRGCDDQIRVLFWSEARRDTLCVAARFRGSNRNSGFCYLVDIAVRLLVSRGAVSRQKQNRFRFPVRGAASACHGATGKQKLYFY